MLDQCAFGRLEGGLSNGLGGRFATLARESLVLVGLALVTAGRSDILAEPSLSQKALNHLAAFVSACHFRAFPGRSRPEPNSSLGLLGSAMIGSAEDLVTAEPCR